MWEYVLCALQQYTPFSSKRGISLFCSKMQSSLRHQAYLWLEPTALNKYKKIKRCIYFEYQFLMNYGSIDKKVQQTSSTAPSDG